MDIFGVNTLTNPWMKKKNNKKAVRNTFRKFEFVAQIHVLINLSSISIVMTLFTKYKKNLTAE